MDKLDFSKLKENTTHGDFILPFSIYKGTMSTSFPLIATHWHEEIEVIIVIDGCCNYRIDLNSFTISKGDILIVGPQKLHSLTALQNQNMTRPKPQSSHIGTLYGEGSSPHQADA